MAYRDIKAEDIYRFERKVLVDIRSPQEFEEFHIPGAVNVPLFENEEKKLVGYVYRNEGIERAKEVGKEIAQRKIEEFYRTFRELKERFENVIVYCWRGGMRSRGMCEAMAQKGLDLYRLEGGYRAYRQFILKDMERLAGGVEFIVLTGKTGVGKTEVLKVLKERGYPVVDLEGLAKDRGSVFGSVGITERVSQKMFDALLYEELRRAGSGLVFIEDESRRIGNIYIPDPVWKRKERGIYVELVASIERRVENIMEVYTRREGWQEEALEAVLRIRKYLGPQRLEYILKRFREGNYREVVRFLMEEYYDRKYRQFGKPIVRVSSEDPRECADRLIELYERLRHEGKVPHLALERG